MCREFDGINESKDIRDPLFQLWYDFRSQDRFKRIYLDNGAGQQTIGSA